MAVRKDVFERIHGFNPHVTLTEEHDLCMRAKEAGFKTVVLRNPRVTFSMRRFRKEGFTRTLAKYTRIYLYAFFKGSPTDDRFSYHMGGHEHE